MSECDQAFGGSMAQLAIWGFVRYTRGLRRKRLPSLEEGIRFLTSLTKCPRRQVQSPNNNGPRRTCDDAEPVQLTIVLPLSVVEPPSTSSPPATACVHAAPCHAPSAGPLPHSHAHTASPRRPPTTQQHHPTTQPPQRPHPKPYRCSLHARPSPCPPHPATSSPHHSSRKPSTSAYHAPPPRPDCHNGRGARMMPSPCS